MGFPAPQHVWLGGVGSGNPEKPSVNPSRHTQTMQKPSSTLRLMEPTSRTIPAPTLSTSENAAHETNDPLALTTEEPGFSSHLGYLQPETQPHRVSLYREAPDRSWIATWITARFQRNPTPGTPRLTAGQRVLSLATLALLATLGCLAANRSVSAFQTAWRVTDTTPTGAVVTPTRYDFQNSDLPKPFEDGSSLWSSFKKHLRLAPQDSPSSKAGK